MKKKKWRKCWSKPRRNKRGKSEEKPTERFALGKKTHKKRKFHRLELNSCINHSLTYSLTHFHARWLTHSLTYSLIHSLIHQSAYSFSCSLIHLLTHSHVFEHFQRNLVFMLLRIDRLFLSIDDCLFVCFNTHQYQIAPLWLGSKPETVKNCICVESYPYHSHIHSFTHSLTHWLTDSLIHSPTHTLIHSFTHSLTYLPYHSLTHLLAHSLTHPITH